MNIDRNINQFERFKHYSQLAAKNEKAGKYEAASAQWASAELCAKRAENREWCKHRAIFCDRVSRKPF